MEFSIRSFLIASWSIFVFSCTVTAQGGANSATPDIVAAELTSVLVEKLKLTEDQSTRVKEINLNYAEKIQEVRTTHAGNRDDMKEIMMAVNKEKNSEIRSVLTEEQIEAFDQMQTSDAQRGGRRGRKGRG